MVPDARWQRKHRNRTCSGCVHGLHNLDSMASCGGRTLRAWWWLVVGAPSLGVPALGVVGGCAARPEAVVPASIAGAKARPFAELREEAASEPRLAQSVVAEPEMVTSTVAEPIAHPQSAPATGLRTRSRSRGAV